MMKKRFMSMVLCIGMAFSAMTACGGGGTGDGTSSGGDNGGTDVVGKTTIKVGTYDGGLGMDWLSDAAKRFEEKYANKSFEEGKTGVAVNGIKL